MADLGTLALGNYTDVADTAAVGSDPLLEVIASANDSDYVHDNTNSDHTGDCWFAVATSLPGDFGTMATLFIELRYFLDAAKGDNDWDSLNARVFQSNGSTPLTDEIVVFNNGGSPIDNTTPADSGAVEFTGVDTSSDGTVWAAAQVHIYFAINRNKGGDSVNECVSAGELTGTYNLAAQDVNVTATTATLSLATQAADVKVDRNVLANTAALTVSTYPATVNAETNVQAGVAALEVATYPADVNLDVSVSAQVAPLALATYPATVNAETNVQASTAALSIATYQAAVSLGVGVDAGVAALSLQTYPATVKADTEVQASTATLSVATYPVNVNAAINVQAGTALLSLASQQANVNAATNVQASTAALTLASYAAEVTVPEAGGDVEVTAACATLVLKTYRAKIKPGEKVFL